MNFVTDLRFATRSLLRARGLTITVVLTLALGIGANAAIFSVVRGVLLRPLVNRDADRLIYIRQSAPGLGMPNTNFSVPEIKDLQAGVKSLSAFGDFSTIEFTMIGLGEPRTVRAGVVGGSYFDVMGLRPVMGRLLGPRDDGRNAEGAAVLTYRFWTSAFKSDPGVIGKVIRLSDRPATVVGVLEPSVPYPQETEIIANVVTSPHHLDATMVEGRVHRMTELFGRLAPGASLESALAELRTVHGAMVKAHPEAYQAQADYRIEARSLRDQIISPARTILLILLAASGLVFVVACSNVANLILARSVRRQGELAVRAALGASTSALRRTLLAESLLLCSAGAVLAVAIARPMVAVLARYAARFSVRANDVTVDASLLWVGAGLAIAAAVLLAYVPKLPSADGANGASLASGGVRITSGTNRRLQVFAVTQIAASFVLVAGAGMLVTTLFALQRQKTGFTGNVTVKNLGDPISGGWNLTWAFAGNQRITQGWSATVTQTGQQVNAASPSWASSLATNATANFGFNADYSPGRLRVANERRAYYDWLYGGDLRLEPEGRGFFEKIHDGRFVERSAEEGRSYDRIALYEAAYEPEKIQFYQLVDIPFARELRQVALNYPYPKQSHLASR